MRRRALQRLKLRKLLHHYDSTSERRPGPPVQPPPLPSQEGSGKSSGRAFGGSGVATSGSGAGAGAGAGASAGPATGSAVGSGAGAGAGAASSAAVDSSAGGVEGGASAASGGGGGGGSAKKPAPAPKSMQTPSPRKPARDAVSSGRGSAGKQGSSGGSGKPKAKKTPTPIYDWEKRALQAERGDVSDESASVDMTEPVGMTEPVIEFQVRLTEKEYRQVLLLRRQRIADKKFMNRAAKLVAASEERAKFITAERGASGIAVSGPYVEPLTLETFMYRTAQPKKWVAEKPGAGKAKA